MSSSSSSLIRPIYWIVLWLFLAGGFWYALSPGNLIRQWFTAPYGPVQLSITFPTGRTGQYEPILSTGSSAGGDVLYAFYDSAESVRFGLVGTTMRGPISPPIAITYGQPYTLVISMGSLYPAHDDPLLEPLGEAVIADLKGMLRVSFDNKDVFSTPAHFFPANSREFFIGRNHHLEGQSAKRFSGDLSLISRLPIITPEALTSPSEEYGTVRLKLRFRRGAVGTEPLVVTGVPGAGDFVYVSYVGVRAFVIGYDHWGTPSHFSKTLFTDFIKEHELEITMGSLFPARDHPYWEDFPSAEADRLKRLVQIKLDGVVVLELEKEAYNSSPHDVRIGLNVLGGSSCGYEFTGEIVAADRLPGISP